MAPALAQTISSSMASRFAKSLEGRGQTGLKVGGGAATQRHRGGIRRPLGPVEIAQSGY